MSAQRRRYGPLSARLSIAGLLAAVLASAACGTAHALSAEAATDQVSASLVASASAVHPGDKITLGVHQRIIPHWHTYWINPGDSGLATRIAWDLPKGASAGGIQWPVPRRFSQGPVTNYGYADEVTLLSALRVPGDAKAGSRFVVGARVNWLVCDAICLPQQVDLGLDLPIVAPGASSGPGNPLIDKARSSLPVASPWPISLEVGKEAIDLRIRSAELQLASIKEISFLPAEWGRISHSAAQTWQVQGDTVSLRLQPGEAPLAAGESLRGVLAVTEDTGLGPVTRGFSVNAAAGQGAGPADIELPGALLLALLGGVLLNLMPCVFPVLSIKALSFLRQGGQSPLQTRLHGLAYSLGVLASFAVLATVLILLKRGGARVGWGFQFQSPLFVLAMAYLMFVIGLSLSGVFAIGGSVAGLGSSLANRSGYAGSFFTGVLATAVATPCTAPFMGAAVGYALTQPPVRLMAVFLSLGLGLALPYMLLSNWPNLQRRLPRPGAWMERLKQALALPMYATAGWLVWVLAQQAGTPAVTVALGGMAVIGFFAWLEQATRTATPRVRPDSAGAVALGLVVALAAGYIEIDGYSPEAARSAALSRQDWEPYTADQFQLLRARGKPVFVNLTAAWCITCLVNEQVALSEPSVADAFRSVGITYLKGDWTNRDPEIAAKLAEFGRGGVPLYLYYPAGIGVKPVVLPQILTPQIVLSAIGQGDISPKPSLTN